MFFNNIHLKLTGPFKKTCSQNTIIVFFSIACIWKFRLIKGNHYVEVSLSSWIGLEENRIDISLRLVPVSSICLLHYKQENLDQARLDNFAHMGIQLHPRKFLDVITHPYPNFNGGSRGDGVEGGEGRCGRLCVQWIEVWADCHEQICRQNHCVVFLIAFVMFMEIFQDHSFLDHKCILLFDNVYFLVIHIPQDLNRLLIPSSL